MRAEVGLLRKANKTNIKGDTQKNYLSNKLYIQSIKDLKGEGKTNN